MGTERAERFYAEFAGLYDLLFDKVFESGRRRSIERLDVQPGESILEVGVGSGLTLQYFPREARITGIDLEEAMLDEAANRVAREGLDHVELRQMDASDLRFEDASFDRVLVPYVLSVVREPERVLSEIARVCKPGGRVIVVNHFGSDHLPLRAFERALTPLSLYMGFVLDLRISSVLPTPELEIESHERVGLFRLWSILQCRRV